MLLPLTRKDLPTCCRCCAQMLVHEVGSCSYSYAYSYSSATRWNQLRSFLCFSNAVGRASGGPPIGHRQPAPTGFSPQVGSRGRSPHRVGRCHGYWLLVLVLGARHHLRKWDSDSGRDPPKSEVGGPITLPPLFEAVGRAPPTAEQPHRHPPRRQRGFLSRTCTLSGHSLVLAPRSLGGGAASKEAKLLKPNSVGMEKPTQKG